MTQSSCKRDTKSKSHPSVKLASVRVFSFKHPLSSLCRENRFGVRILYYCTYQTSQWLLCNLASYCSIFSPSSHGPYGFYARTQAFLELIAFLFLFLSPGKFEATPSERVISYLISKQARVTLFRAFLFL